MHAANLADGTAQLSMSGGNIPIITTCQQNLSPSLLFYLSHYIVALLHKAQASTQSRPDKPDWSCEGSWWGPAGRGLLGPEGAG